MDLNPSLSFPCVVADDLPDGPDRGVVSLAGEFIRLLFIFSYVILCTVRLSFNCAGRRFYYLIKFKQSILFAVTSDTPKYICGCVQISIAFATVNVKLFRKEPCFVTSSGNGNGGQKETFQK